MYLDSAVVLFDLAHNGFEMARMPGSSMAFYIWVAVSLAYLVSRSLRHFTRTFDGIS